jgi:beta-1,4-N-acetylglucosaminyltransferase
VIFVTVGTTLPFDDLVRAVDRLAAQGALAEPVLCQIGHGQYVPGHCEHFRFKPNLDEETGRASLVIGHGGTGTVTGLLSSGKPFIAVANPLGAHDHQRQFLARLCKVVDFLWTADLSELPALIERARSFRPQSATAERLTEDLKRYLLQPEM